MTMKKSCASKRYQAAQFPNIHFEAQPGCSNETYLLGESLLKSFYSLIHKLLYTSFV